MEFKLSFKADPCESQLELVGTDAPEKVKRATKDNATGGSPGSSVGSYSGQSLKTVVSTVFNRQQIIPPSNVPDTGTQSPTRDILMQSHNDLELLRRLADENAVDVYVEPEGDRDQGHFEALAVGKKNQIPTGLQANQGSLSPVRSASFFYDLTGPTAVEAQFTDAKGKKGETVRADLRDSLTDEDMVLLGPADFANVVRLERHGLEDSGRLKRRCQAELEKHSWVVVGKGELDTAAYGDFLLARRTVNMKGVSSSFTGDFLVWQVTHSFTRDLYCQRFELRKKLGFK